MALTHTIVARTVFGDKYVTVTESTFDNSYPTGGEPITAAEFGLSSIEAVFISHGSAFGSLVGWNKSGSTLLVRDSGANAGDVFPEQANATDLSTLVVHLIVVGRR
jgi:hypothetical protein